VRKTWWDCVNNDMRSFGLDQKDTQVMSKCRMNKDHRGNRLIQVHLENSVCMCVSMCSFPCYPVTVFVFFIYENYYSLGIYCWMWYNGLLSELAELMVEVVK